VRESSRSRCRAQNHRRGEGLSEIEPYQLKISQQPCSSGKVPNHWSQADVITSRKRKNPLPLPRSVHPNSYPNRRVFLYQALEVISRT